MVGELTSDTPTLCNNEADIEAVFDGDTNLKIHEMKYLQVLPIKDPGKNLAFKIVRAN